MSVLRILSKHFHDLCLTHCIFELLILNKKLLFHGLHSHYQTGILVLYFEYFAESTLPNQLYYIKISELRMIRVI